MSFDKFPLSFPGLNLPIVTSQPKQLKGFLLYIMLSTLSFLILHMKEMTKKKKKKKKKPHTHTSKKHLWLSAVKNE